MAHSRKGTKLLSIVSVSVLVSGLFLQFAPTDVHAADFDIEISRTYTVSSDNSSIHISEERRVSSNSFDYYIPSTSSEIFSIQDFKQGLPEEEFQEKKGSISVTNGSNTDLPYTTSREGNDIVVDVPYSSALTTGDSATFILEYDTSELIETVGSITNIYIPGLKDTYEEITTDTNLGTTTRITYQTALVVPKDLNIPTFTLPQPSNTSTDSQHTTYTFSTESIIGTAVWHQIGTHQTYHFRLVQPLSPTDTTTPDMLTFLSKNQYQIVLPRDYAETNQNVFFTKIEPTPDEVFLDDDGNVLANFYIDTKDLTAIQVEGYITVSQQDEITTDNSTSTVADVPDDMDQYLASAEYWESNHPDIQEKAAELSQGKTFILDILKSDYEFIVDSIDYDDFKYGDRNERQGALMTLHGESSVCMEYSDLLIALARAQGIPARAAYGYGYDPKYKPGEQEEHQWVQAWVPGYGWLTLDPTWGETGREFIGSDLDHALWYVASIDPNEPSPLTILSASANITIEDSTIEITAIEEIPTDEILLSANELVDDIGEETSPVANVSRTIQTSIVGRFLVILLPICGSILFVTLLAYTLFKFGAKLFRKRQPVPSQTPRTPNTR